MELPKELSVHQLDSLLRLFRSSCNIITEGELNKSLDGSMFLAPSQESLLDLMNAIKYVKREFDW